MVGDDKKVIRCIFFFFESEVAIGSSIYTQFYQPLLYCHIYIC
jgi:hypothetical protein